MSAWAVTAETLRIGTEGAYPPFNFINDNGTLDGLDREFGDELCRRMQVKCEWVLNDWDTIIPNLVGGNYDLVIATMGITSERDAVIDFSEPYLPAEPSAYAALSAATDNVVNANIAAQANTIQADHVVKTGGTLVEFPTPDAAIAAVKNGEADAVLAGKKFLKGILAESGGELAFVGNDVDLGVAAGVGLRENSGSLLQQTDSAIISMKKDGYINDLIEKWLGPDAEKF